MKKRTRAALALALFVLQLFCIFIPVSAADATEGEGTWVETSFNETTIAQDLGAKALEKYPLVESSDKTAAEIIAAITRAGQDLSKKGVALYLYIYVPSGTEDFKAGTVKLSKADYTLPLVPSMKKIDMTATILKVRIDLTESDYNDYLTAGKDRFQIYLESFQLKWYVSRSIQTVSYDAISRALSGGKLTSGILLTVSLDGEPIEWYVAETLKLDVHLSAERYSTPNNGEFSQLNTAMFLVPSEYFYSASGKHLSMDQIVYEAAYYHDVPMVVTEAKGLKNYYESNYGDIMGFADLWGAYDTPDLILPKPVPEFVLFVEEIAESAGGKVDVPSEELLKAYDIARENWEAANYGRPFSTYIHAGSYVPLQSYIVKVKEEIKTESYADGASWWTRFIGHRLIGKNEDDSIKLDSVQAIDREAYFALHNDGPPSLDAIKETYGIDGEGYAQMRSLASEAGYYEGSDDYVIVLLHMGLTSYKVSEIDVAFFTDTSKSYDYIYKMDPADGSYAHSYQCFSSIIAGFRIIQLEFLNEDVRQIVPTVMPTLTFIAGLEGDEKLEDETYDPPEVKLPSWLPDFNFSGAANKITKMWNTVKQIFRIILIVVIVGVCIWGGTKVFKFIGAARDAFGRRGGGKGGGGSG